MHAQSKNWYAEIAVAVLVVALIVLSIFLVRQYRVAARQGIISVEHVHFADIIRLHSLGAADAGLIAPWMTFDYVSVSYKVPVPFLKAALQIPSSTKGYPNITISRYSKTIATSSDALTVEVQNAVKSYLAPAQAASQTSSRGSPSSAQSPNFSPSTTPPVQPSQSFPSVPREE